LGVADTGISKKTVHFFCPLPQTESVLTCPVSSDIRNERKQHADISNAIGLLRARRQRPRRRRAAEQR